MEERERESLDRTVPIIPRPSSSTSYRYVFRSQKNMLVRKYEIYCTSCIRGYCVSGGRTKLSYWKWKYLGGLDMHTGKNRYIPRSMSTFPAAAVIGFKKKVRRKIFLAAQIVPQETPFLTPTNFSSRSLSFDTYQSPSSILCILKYIYFRKSVLKERNNSVVSLFDP